MKQNIISTGFNHPPKNISCNPKICRQICKDYCIHAEEHAILNSDKSSLENAVIYHARLIDNNGKFETANSRKPRCLRCANLILDCGLSGFVLKHEEGVAFYSAKENYNISLENTLK